jgi:hypothetical protein
MDAVVYNALKAKNLKQEDLDKSYNTLVALYILRFKFSEFSQSWTLIDKKATDFLEKVEIKDHTNLISQFIIRMC